MGRIASLLANQTSMSTGLGSLRKGRRWTPLADNAIRFVPPPTTACIKHGRRPDERGADGSFSGRAPVFFAVWDAR